MTSALVFLFLAEAQRAFFPAALGLARDTAGPALSPGRAALLGASLLALLLPLLPLPRWLERGGAVAVAAAGVAIFRVPMIHPALPTRLAGAALVLAFAGLFLAWGSGWLDRGAVMAGAVSGLVVDQLLRLPGGGRDPSLAGAWLPVQLALSIALLASAGVFERATDAGEPPRGLERRSGGLRRRGALALGLLLFLDLQFLGNAAAVAAWAGAPFAMAALAGACGAGAAMAVLLGHSDLTRTRAAAVALAALMAAGFLARGAGTAGVVALAVGHGAALLLIARVLEPAAGRRTGVAVTLGLVVFVAVTGAHLLLLHPGAGTQARGGGGSWLIAAASTVVVALMVLLPHALETSARAGKRTAWLTGAAVVAVAVAILLISRTPGTVGR